MNYSTVSFMTGVAALFKRKNATGKLWQLILMDLFFY